MWIEGVEQYKKQAGHSYSKSPLRVFEKTSWEKNESGEAGAGQGRLEVPKKWRNAPGRTAALYRVEIKH